MPQNSGLYCVRLPGVYDIESYIQTFLSHPCDFKVLKKQQKKTLDEIKVFLEKNRKLKNQTAWRKRSTDCSSQHRFHKTWVLNIHKTMWTLSNLICSPPAGTCIRTGPPKKNSIPTNRTAPSAPDPGLWQRDSEALWQKWRVTNFYANPQFFIRRSPHLISSNINKGTQIICL